MGPIPDQNLSLILKGDYFELFQMEVERELWTGRFGKVLLARSERYPDITRVVRKTSTLASDLERESWTLEEVKRVLYREAALLKYFEHKHIVGGGNLVVCPDYILVAMDYCAGGSLLDCIRRITHVDMFVFAMALLSALNYLHAHQIFHADIKPSKVLLMCYPFSDYQKPVLAGFTLARRCHNPDNTTDRYFNSVAFRVPEVWNARGQYRVNPFKCDLYKFGLVLLCMIMRAELPDWSQDSLHLARTHPFITDLLRATLVSCLEKDPSKRAITSAVYDFWRRNIRPEQCRLEQTPRQV